MADGSFLKRLPNGSMALSSYLDPGEEKENQTDESYSSSHEPFFQADIEEAVNLGRSYEALKVFRQRLAVTRQANTLQTVVAIGPSDSNGEGYNASSFQRRWWFLMGKELQRGTENHHWHYFAAAPGGVFPGGYPGGVTYWTRTGTYTDASGGRGLGQRAVDIAAGATMTLSFLGTFARIAVTRLTTSPTNGLTVKINGTSVGTLNPNGATASVVLDIPGGQLQYGLHSLELSNTGGAGDIRIEGAHTYDGTAAKGVYVLDNSHSASGAQNYAEDTTWAETYTLIPPHLVILPVGAGDRFDGRTSAEFEADLIVVINAINTAADAASAIRPSILLVAFPTSPVLEDAESLEPWENYIEVMRDVAALDSTSRAVLDLTSLIPDGIFPAYVNAVTDLLSDDDTHLNDAGQRWVADRILEVIDPRPPAGFTKSAVRGPVSIIAQQTPDGESPAAWVLACISASGTGSSPQGTWYRTSATGSAVGQQSYRVWLEAGTYVLAYTGYKGAALGIVAAGIDGASAGTMDMYNATTQLVGQAFGTSLVVADSGWHLVYIKKNGTKNASASDYAVLWSRLDLIRTA